MITTDLDETVRHLLDQSTNRALTTDEIQTAGCRVGRNNYPALVVDLYYSDALTPGVLAVVVPDAWGSAEFPERSVDRELWVQMFDDAGYTVNHEPAKRPSGTLTLYRGALPEFRVGMAWTDDIEQARWFAGRWELPGVVYTATVPAVALLARLDDPEVTRGEAEYVVNTLDYSLVVEVADA